jgi:sn-glycerol 3-phosphate transport system substrate-binding protein
MDIDVAPLPGLSEAGRGQVSGGAWYLAAAASPAEQAAAWTFLTWWNQPDQQVAWGLEGTYLPYNAQAISDAGLQSVWQHTRRGRWLDTAYTQITNVDQGSPGPLIGPYSAVRAAIVQSMSAVTRGDMDPAISVNEADSTIDADLIEYQLAHS